MSPETIEVSRKEWFELKERDAFLCALEAAGVDNWNGYGEAQDILEEWNNDN